MSPLDFPPLLAWLLAAMLVWTPVKRAVAADSAEQPVVFLPNFPDPAPMKGETVLFAFDESAFPQAEGVTRELVRGVCAKTCIAPGPANAPDQRLAYYGAVVQLAADDLRIWYLGVGSDGGFRFCYATSREGFTWNKPELGLVEFAGTKANNLIDFPIGPKSLHEPVVVLYDRDASDPEQRFKMAFEYLPETTWGTAASPDGLRWHLLTKEKIKPWLEMSGVTKYRGRYYVTGQGGFPQPKPWYRRLGVFVSDDFVTWNFAAVGLDRSPKGDADYQFLKHEQIHLGAGLWNRGDVILGVYGQWHGVPEGKEFKTINMLGDLGLALSHDAEHFVEPVPGYAFIEEKSAPRPPQDGPYAHALMQGQGMYNLGEQTLFWFAHWGGPLINVATWKRDRLGYLAPQAESASILSCPIRVVQGEVKVYLNVEVPPGAKLTATVLGNGDQAVPGFEKLALTGDFLRQPLVWEGNKGLTRSAGTVRLKFSGTGDWKLYALYLGDGEPQFLKPNL